MTSILITSVCCFWAINSAADLFYDPVKSDELKSLSSVQAARLSMEYICESSSLYLSGYAATSEINGRSASITGKIVSGDKNHDISVELNRAIESEDILTRGLNVQCNQESGAFQIAFSREARGGESVNKVTTISIFSDGTVLGSRSRRRVKKK